LLPGADQLPAGLSIPAQATEPALLSARQGTLASSGANTNTL